MKKGAKVKSAIGRLTTRAYRQHRFTDDYGCTHDGVRQPHEHDLVTVLREIKRLRGLVRYYAPDGVA